MEQEIKYQMEKMPVRCKKHMHDNKNNGPTMESNRIYL